MKKLQLEINKKLEKILQELVVTTQEEFSNAPYAGNNDVVVEYEMNSNGGRLIASGSAVGFIEYGTGISFPEHPTGKYAHGSFGKGQGANPKGWYYKGEQGNMGEIPTNKSLADKGLIHTYGNPPSAIMYRASETIKERLK